MSLKTSLRLHTAGLTSSHKHPRITAGHIFMSLGPISTEKYYCDNAHSAVFLPPSTMSTSFSATENEPVLFKQSVCFKTFLFFQGNEKASPLGKVKLRTTYITFT